MDNERCRALLEQLMQAASAGGLQEAIEKNLTKLDMEFDDWLEMQVSIAGEGDHQMRDIIATIRRRTAYIVCRGDYRKAIFNESSPENVKELLLALERKVERGESSLASASEQGARILFTSPWKDLYSDLTELIESIMHSPDKSAFVTIAELLYQIERQMPEPLTGNSYDVLIRILSDRSMKQRALHEFDHAMESYDRIIAVSSESQNFEGLCVGLMSKGDVCQVNLSSSDYPDHLSQAEEYYVKALEVCTRGELDLHWRADILLELGKTLNGQRRYQEAIKILQECLLLYRSGNSLRDNDVYNCLIELGDASLNAGDFSAASAYIRESIRDAPNPEDRAARLARLTTVLGHLVDEEAGKAIAEAVQIVEEISIKEPAHGLRSAVYGVLGTYQTRKGDFQGAIDTYQIAIDAAKAGGHEGDEARWLSNLGQIYLYLNQWENAEFLFRTAGRVHAKLYDDLGAANLTLNLGYMYVHRGELDYGAELFSLAFALFYQEQHPGDMLFPAIGLCQIYKEKGDLQRAEACIRYCLAKAESLGSARITFYALGELAELKTAQMQLEEAACAYERAVALAQQAGELMAEQDYRISYGEFLEQNGSSPEAAEKEYRRAVELQELARGRFRIVERRIQFQNRSEKSYARLVLLLSKRRDRGRCLADAFDFSERARSRTLIELLSRRPVRHPPLLAPELVQQERSLLAQLSRLEASDEVGIEPARLYMQLNKQLEAIWEEMAKQGLACREYIDLRRTPLVSLAEVKGLLE